MAIINTIYNLIQKKIELGSMWFQVFLVVSLRFTMVSYLSNDLLWLIAFLSLIHFTKTFQFTTKVLSRTFSFVETAIFN